MPGMTARGAAGTPLGVAVLAGLPAWMLMAAAMTLAGVVPAAEHLAVNSFPRRRSLRLCVFLAVYLLVWLIVGAGLLALIALAGAAPGAALFGASLGLAGAYELSGLKRRALNRCHRTTRLPPSGWRGALAAARFAWVNTTGCVGTCWLAMVAMLLGAPARPLTMVALTGASTCGRWARRPDRTRRRLAAGYMAAAALVLAYAV